MNRISFLLFCFATELAYISGSALPAMAQSYGNGITGGIGGAVGGALGTVSVTAPAVCPANLYALGSTATGKTESDAQSNCKHQMLDGPIFTNWAQQCNACGGTINAPINYGIANYTENAPNVTVACVVQVAQCIK